MTILSAVLQLLHGDAIGAFFKLPVDKAPESRPPNLTVGSRRSNITALYMQHTETASGVACVELCFHAFMALFVFGQPSLHCRHAG